MAHISKRDKLNQAIWLTGTPGCGFNTVGSRLGGFMLDWIGYRTTHLKHREWLCSIPILKFKITDPDLKNPFFYGFAQNWSEMANQPWAMIIIMDVSYPQLLKRVTAFRGQNSISDGESHEAVTKSLFSIQQSMLKALGSHPRAHVLKADEPAETLVSAIRTFCDPKQVAKGTANSMGLFTWPGKEARS